MFTLQGNTKIDKHYYGNNKALAKTVHLVYYQAYEEIKLLELFDIQ